MVGRSSSRRQVGGGCLFAGAAAALLLTLASPASAQERIEIQSPTLRWQPMTKEVAGVTVGPDGRIWYQLSPVSAAENQPHVQRAIEREFREKSPQIAGAELALLDQQGRAWFYFRNRTELLGYDGEKWIEPEIEVVKPLRGWCPTRGRLLDGVLDNISAGERVFFHDRTQVHVFDGKKWLTMSPPTDERGQPTNTELAVSPNGKWAVAAVRTDEHLWVLREGGWEKFPEKIEQAQPIRKMVVTDSGVLWWIASNAELKSVRLDPNAPTIRPSTAPAVKRPDEEIAELIRQLDHESFAVRTAAQESLLSKGRAILPKLEQALTSATTAEAKFRLKTLIAEVKPLPPSRNRAAGTVPAAASTQVGTAKVARVNYLGLDRDGRLFVAAMQLFDESGTDGGPGLVMVAADGTTTVLRGSDNRFTYLQALNGSGAVLAESGDKLWLSSPMGMGGPKLLDLTTGETTLEIREGGFPYIRAVDGEGRVYLARFYSGVVPGMHVMVYSPNGKEDRLPIDVDSSGNGSDDTLIASDGSIWTVRPSDGLYRFDGEGWRQVERWRTFIRLLGAGTNGEVLVRCEDLMLWRGDELIARGGKDLKEFVRDNRETFAEAFHAKTLAPTSLQNADTVVADASGNIWVLENEHLYVLVKDEWIEAREFMKAAGSRRGTARLLAPIGDGSRLYVSDMHLLHDGGKAFFAEVKDGVPTFYDAPHTTLSYGDPRPLRDRRGDLWIHGNIAKANGTSDAIFGHFAARLSTKGMTREIKNVGHVLHVDQSDNVWLADRFPKPSNRLTILRDDKIVGRVDIPHVDAVHAVFSDRPGSVYALSTRGLEHLVAEGPEYRDFRHEATYLAPNPGQQMHLRAYSSLGYFVLVGGPVRPGAGNQIHLIRLPKEAKK